MCRGATRRSRKAAKAGIILLMRKTCLIAAAVAAASLRAQIQIREAMAALARKTKEPTPEDVQAAVSPLGVKYVPLNYADVLAGMQYFNTLVRRFKVPGTPSVVVLDSRTGKSKTLFGITDITSDNILKTLAEVSGK